MLELRSRILLFIDRGRRLFVMPIRHLPDEHGLDELRRLPSWDDVYFPGGLLVVDMR